MFSNSLGGDGQKIPKKSRSDHSYVIIKRKLSSDRPEYLQEWLVSVRLAGATYIDSHAQHLGIKDSLQPPERPALLPTSSSEVTDSVERSFNKLVNNTEVKMWRERLQNLKLSAKRFYPIVASEIEKKFDDQDASRSKL